MTSVRPRAELTRGGGSTSSAGWGRRSLDQEPGAVYRAAVAPRFSVSQITTINWPFERDLEAFVAAGVPGIGVSPMPHFKSQPRRGPMDDDVVIEISNVWKIFGVKPELALKAIHERGLTKAEVLAEFNAVVGVADVSLNVKRGETVGTRIRVG